MAAEMVMPKNEVFLLGILAINNSPEMYPNISLTPIIS